MVADKVEARLRAAPVLQPRLLTVDQAAQVLGRSAFVCFTNQVLICISRYPTVGVLVLDA